MEPIRAQSQWTIDRSKPKPEFTRTKNGKIVKYVAGKILGQGERSIVYEVLPVSEGKWKTKAVKVDQQGSLPEHALLMKINAAGPVTGISKAPKAYFPTQIKDKKNRPMMVMPKYRDNLARLVMRREMSEKELLEGLKQVVMGLQYLKDHELFHGDVNSHNVFVGDWKGKKRFDLADFEFAADLSTYKTRQELEMRLNRVPGDWAKLENPTDLKQSFYSVDAGFFGLLIKDIHNLLPQESNLKGVLYELGNLTMQTRTIDGLLKRLEELEVSLPSPQATASQRE